MIFLFPLVYIYDTLYFYLRSPFLRIINICSISVNIMLETPLGNQENTTVQFVYINIILRIYIQTKFIYLDVISCLNIYE